MPALMRLVLIALPLMLASETLADDSPAVMRSGDGSGSGTAKTPNLVDSKPVAPLPDSALPDIRLLPYYEIGAAISLPALVNIGACKWFGEHGIGIRGGYLAPDDETEWTTWGLQLEGNQKFRDTPRSRHLVGVIGGIAHTEQWVTYTSGYFTRNWRWVTTRTREWEESTIAYFGVRYNYLSKYGLSIGAGLLGMRGWGEINSGVLPFAELAYVYRFLPE
jgi:hypothetical protein